MINRLSENRLDESKSDLNISPMIDMVFILLIFFIVTTVFVDEQGIAVDKPQPGQNPASEREVIQFSVTNTSGVFHDNREIGVRGVRGAVERALRKGDRPVIVSVEPSAPAAIMVAVMDAARLGGAKSISVTTSE